MNLSANARLFARAQLSAFIGGLTDFAVMIALTELFGMHYTLSIVFGGIVGAMVNYTINRKWAFQADNISKRDQIPKFLCVVAGTIFLKSTGTYLLTEYGQLDYKISRIIADAFVAIGFNYTLQRFWVFKKSV